MREGNLTLCLVCRKPIEEGEATKKLNRGGKVGVRHESCAQSVSSCQYIVDLTKTVTEELPAKRNEDLFPCDRLTGNKRFMPEGNDADGEMDNVEASTRDPRRVRCANKK